MNVWSKWKYLWWIFSKERLQNEKTSYRMTSSLLPFTPARPNLIVTSLKSDKVVFPGPPLRPPERVTIPVTLGGISGTSRTIIKSICSPTANWRQARYQSKLKLQVGLIFISSLGKKSAYVSVFERMTYTIYPPPSNYFVTLSKIKESRFFSWRPPAFSDDVILYDVFSFWRRSLVSVCIVLSSSVNRIQRVPLAPLGW